MDALPQRIQEWIHALSLNPSFWLGLIALFLLIILWARMYERFKPIKVSKNGIGQIRVSRSALDGLVRMACKREYACQPCVRVSVTGGKINIEVRVKSKGEQPIHNLATRLQTGLAQILYENIGEDEIGSIDVIIRGLKPSKKALEKDESYHLVDKEALMQKENQGD
jgi:hypothetical protein